MKIVVSGGGTGGHIYPAVAIIEEFRRRDPEVKILYVGTEHGLENNIIPDLGINFKKIHVKGLPRKINKKSLIALKELFKGLRESKKIIRTFQPDIVIGTGGYVSGPVLFAAARSKIFTVFHEQNSYPGITNKILSNYANLYFVTFKESIKHFKNNQNAVVSGNPIRNRFENMSSDKKEDYNYFQLDKDKKTVFSFGGSNGADSINQAVLKMLDMIKGDMDMQLIHVTGKNNYDDFIEKAGLLPENIKVYPYMKEMDKAYNVSDLIITSSGAITLSEISYIGLASILIPKSYTTENHQEYNARVYEDNGAAKVILEKDLTAKNLYQDIKNIISSPARLQEMKLESKKLAKPNAAKIIVDEIYKRIR